MSLKNKNKNINTKLSINIDFNSGDCGFAELTTKKVFNFLLKNLQDGNNLINIQKNKYFNLNGKTQLKLQAIKHNKWKFATSWDNIQCKKYNNTIKITPCKIGSKREKIFFKLQCNNKIAGFALYLMGLNMGTISLTQHIEFIKVCKLIFKSKDIYIENMDVDWFHILSKFG